MIKNFEFLILAAVNTALGLIYLALYLKMGELLLLVSTILSLFMGGVSLLGWKLAP